jgi:hypothetical protein
VTRGVRKKHRRGKTSAPKHGYEQDVSDYYVPAPTFELIQQAWIKREKEESLKTINQYLNDNNYYRATKTGKKLFMTNQKLSNMFKDPFYCGK